MDETEKTGQILYTPIYSTEPCLGFLRDYFYLSETFPLSLIIIILSFTFNLKQSEQ